MARSSSSVSVSNCGGIGGGGGGKYGGASNGNSGGINGPPGLGAVLTFPGIGICIGGAILLANKLGIPIFANETKKSINFLAVTKK